MKIAVLLSGGVDSSVALARLKESGYTDITAYYLKIWLEDEVSYLGDCPWEEDLSYARGVCEKTGTELKIIPLQTEYFDRVVEYALAELKAGRTPSPDIFCNQRVKFGAFFDRVGESVDRVATGHYARLGGPKGFELPAIASTVAEHGTVTMPAKPPFDPWGDYSSTTEDVAALAAGSGFQARGAGLQTTQALPQTRLLRAPDPVKDQTYFLSHLSPYQVSRLLFPVGDLPKKSVRQLAQKWELPTVARPDSQGICFLGKIPYNEFVRHYLGTKEGPIVEASSGAILGTHQGFWFHTVGQRTGLGLGNGPWYVSAKDPEQNIVYISHASDNPVRDRSTLEIAEINWTSGLWPDSARLERWNNAADALLGNGYNGLQCKLRHGPALIPCKLSWLDGFSPADAVAPEARRLFVSLSRSDAGIAAGQFCVLYFGDECLGGGKIREPEQNFIAELSKKHAFWVAAEAEAQARKPKKKRKAGLPTQPRHTRESGLARRTPENGTH